MEIRPSRPPSCSRWLPIRFGRRLRFRSARFIRQMIRWSSRAEPLAPPEPRSRTQIPAPCSSTAPIRRRRSRFLSARVALASFESDLNGPAGVRFDVMEGVQTYVREIAFAGFPPGFLPKADAIKVGQPLRRAAVDQSRGELLRDLGHHGYLFARVDANTELSGDHRTAKLTFQATSGPRWAGDHSRAQSNPSRSCAREPAGSFGRGTRSRRPV